MFFSSYANGQNDSVRKSLPGDRAIINRRAFPDQHGGSSSFNLNSKPLVFELSETPLPFLDWSVVDVGQIGWIGERGDVVPLSEKHDYQDEKQILPVPFSVASGVRIRAQKPEKQDTDSTFFPATLPWEGREPHTLIHDEDNKLYHLWYNTKIGTAYAESRDLKSWTKPLVSPIKFEGYPKTNAIYIANANERERWMFQQTDAIRPGASGTFFKDPSAPPVERFKTTFLASSDPEKLRAFAERTGKHLSPMVSAKSGNCVYGAVSPDGIAWTILKDPILLHDADTMTVNRYDRELERYVSYTRLFELGRRTIARTESKDFRDFPLPQSVLAPGPEDPPFVDFYANSMCTYPGIPSLRMIFGLVYDRSIDDSCVRLATSRNGTLWHWMPGDAVLKGGLAGRWDEHFVRTIPSFVPTPDNRMMICYNGNLLPHKFPRQVFQSGGWGVLSWKRDRLAAIEAPERGEFTTCVLKLRRNRILLNMETERAGEISVQVFDEHFKAIAGRTFEEAEPLNGDGIAVPVTWNGKSDLSAYRDKVVYLRFKMRAAKLYAIHAGD